MKALISRIFMVVLSLLCLTACMKDDLDAIDIKVDGSMKTSISTGSSSGVHSRARSGLSF